LFKQSYDQWNGQGAFAQALAVPEPASFGLFFVGLACSRWVWMTAIAAERQLPARSDVFDQSSTVVD
jgi:hypothetical protein